MKKIISILFLSIILMSCKKEGTVCWKCTFQTVNGYTRPDETICNDGQQPTGFKDAAGNDVGSFCTRQ